MLASSSALKRFQALYLNADGADVWFVFDKERIPAHKLILVTMSPWFETMFFGSLPESNEVNMTDANVSAEAFKEFLRFIYMSTANLTMDNIEGVIHLAKQSLSDEIFAKCEDFLMNNVNTETMFFGYQLALTYDANRLRKMCEEEICVNAEQVLKSRSFIEFPFQFLTNILRCDALACDEKVIFKACIAWAKASCARTNQDPLNAEHLRAHLKDSIYQIRFCSMNVKEFAACISSYSGLFSADEMHEIVCMIGRVKEFNGKKFNWTPRYYDLNWNQGQQLICDRFKMTKGLNKLDSTDVTTFSCNRRVLLTGFICECNQTLSISAKIDITEKPFNGTEQTERYRDEVTLNFEYNRGNRNYSQALVELKKPLLLRPSYSYKITVNTESNEQLIGKIFGSWCQFKPKVVLDFDILIRFGGTKGFVSALQLCRFDRKNIIQKVCRNPSTWTLV